MAIRQLEPCIAENRQALTLVQGRLHLARGPGESTELFLEGSRESFGLAAVGRSLEWGPFHDLSAGREFQALVVRAREGDITVRLMAHLSYEATRLLASAPDMSNSELLERLGPFIELIIHRRMLSVHQQMGLTGELVFFFELLNFAENHMPHIGNRSVLNAWTGWDSSRRDFAGNRVAVEVKATGQDSRRHAVHPMYQLLPDTYQPDEMVYVFSLGLKPDRSSAFTLLTAFDRVFPRLDQDAKRVFHERISHYGGVGFDVGLKSHYVLEPGFVMTQPPALFRVDQLPDILRPESFVGGQPPRRATRLRYDVSLEGLAPVLAEERGVLYERLLFAR